MSEMPPGSVAIGGVIFVLPNREHVEEAQVGYLSPPAEFVYVLQLEVSPDTYTFYGMTANSCWHTTVGDEGLAMLRNLHAHGEALDQSQMLQLRRPPQLSVAECLATMLQEWRENGGRPLGRPLEPPLVINAPSTNALDKMLDEALAEVLDEPTSEGE